VPSVDIVVNGRRHAVQCDEGQETRVKRLAAYVDRRLGDLVQTHGQIGDTRLLVMTSLLIADELSDAYDEVKRLRGARSGGGEDGDAEAERVASAMARAAERLEAIASRLESA
jgi:cell division protein ZapA